MHAGGSVAKAAESAAPFLCAWGVKTAMPRRDRVAARRLPPVFVQRVVTPNWRCGNLEAGCGECG